MYAIGLRSAVTGSCKKIAPKPTGLASVITLVGTFKLKQAKDGASDSASFKALNAFACSFSHVHFCPLRVSLLSGSTMLA